MDFGIFLALARALNDEGVSYVLIGGVAMNLQGIARATADIDMFVQPEASNIAGLKRAMHHVWNDPAIEEISADDLIGDYPAVQYGPPDGDMTVDILTRLGEAFRFSDLEAETLEVQGIPVSVATPRTLYRMKRSTVRPRDRADAAALRERYHLEDD